MDRSLLYSEGAVGLLNRSHSGVLDDEKLDRALVLEVSWAQQLCCSHPDSQKDRIELEYGCPIVALIDLNVGEMGGGASKCCG